MTEILPRALAASQKAAPSLGVTLWISPADAQLKRVERAFPTHKTVVLLNASHFLQEDASAKIAGNFAAVRDNGVLLHSNELFEAPNPLS